MSSQDAESIAWAIFIAALGVGLGAVLIVFAIVGLKIFGVI